MASSLNSPDMLLASAYERISGSMFGELRFLPFDPISDVC
jgi:hypothetical protein